MEWYIYAKASGISVLNTFYGMRFKKFFLFLLTVDATEELLHFHFA